MSPVLRLCDDDIVGNQELNFYIGLTAGCLFMASLLSSVILFGLGDYYAYYNCSRVWLCWCCPIIHPMFLQDALYASNPNYERVLKRAAVSNRSLFFVQHRLNRSTCYSLSKQLNEAGDGNKDSLEKQVWFKVLHDEEKPFKKGKVWRIPPLHIFAREEKIILYSVLTFLGVSGMSQDEFGSSAAKSLLKALSTSVGLKSGSLVRRWLFRDQEWIKMFKEAAELKLDRILGQLLENSQSLNVFNHDDGKTALHFACSVQNYNLVKQLLSKRCDVNAKNFKGESPLHLVTSEGHLDILELLLEHDADVNSKDNLKTTPLHNAACRGFLDCCKLLIAKHAAVNEKDSNEFTPFFYSTLKNNVDCMKLLVENGADINASDHYNESPLHAASTEGFYDACQLIINSGGIVNARNMDGDTPLHLAAASTSRGSGTSPEVDFVRCCLLLVHCGADLNARNESSLTPLDYKRVMNLGIDYPELSLDP